MAGPNAAGKVIEVRFYELSSGSEPVREWLRGLPREERRKIGEDLKDIEFNWPVGMPTCEKVAPGLWASRTKLRDKREARVFFCLQGRLAILVHSTIKKDRKIRKTDKELALRRAKEVCSR